MSKVLTMITRHGSDSKNITGYTLISSDYQTITVSADNLIKKIKDKSVVVTNLELKNGKLESTNGALDNYTLIDSKSGAVIGTPRAIVLDRAEANEKLVGYTVFMPNGSLAEMSIADTVKLCNQKLIANGKIRHTQQGDIVQSIGGDYPLREVALNKAPTGDIAISAIYFATVGKLNYAGAMISCTSAAGMTAIRSEIEASNSKVIAESKKLGNKETRSLEIQRAGATSLFGVISLPALDKLVKKGGKLSALTDQIVISAIKYDGATQYESTLTLNKNLNISDESKSGVDELDNSLKTYAKTVIGYLKTNIK